MSWPSLAFPNTVFLSKSVNLQFHSTRGDFKMGRYVCFAHNEARRHVLFWGFPVWPHESSLLYVQGGGFHGIGLSQMDNAGIPVWSLSPFRFIREPPLSRYIQSICKRTCASCLCSVYVRESLCRGGLQWALLSSHTHLLQKLPSTQLTEIPALIPLS